MAIERKPIGSLKSKDVILVIWRGSVLDLWRDADDRGNSEPLRFTLGKATFVGTGKGTPGYMLHGHLKDNTKVTWDIGPFHVSTRPRTEVQTVAPAIEIGAGSVSLDGATGTAQLILEVKVTASDGAVYVLTADTSGPVTVKAQ